MNQLDFYDLAPDNAVYTAISSRLRYYRGLRGMKQDELAKKSGVSRSTISKIESGYRKPYSTAVFIALARTLQIPLENLLTDKLLT